MKRKRKIILVGIMGLCMTGMTVFAQSNKNRSPENRHTNTTFPDSAKCCHKEILSTEQTSIIPQFVAFNVNTKSFAVINVVDNTIDMIVNKSDTMERVCRHEVDHVAGRHDLDLVYRPKSIAVYGNQVVFLAANRDSSYIGVLSSCGKEVNRIAFKGYTDAFNYSPCSGQFTVIGQSQLGYTLLVFNQVKETQFSELTIEDGMQMTYRKPKKAEEIQASDPIGVGLTVAAISVVFIVLLFLVIIFTQYGKFLTKLQHKRATKIATQHATTGKEIVKVPSHVSGEVYAAIASAIHLYNEELHDEENTVITIQKVERAWTPWNAKYYNMNQYFNKRR